ncbi:LysR family transcriptional regulator [Sodalis sp. dw_96]|uniref:LysR family transcriptional regulator n=1 Tax=Sodalis sp. dw_96 TaxID=2719794 RepID=UPI001BD5CDBC|nr:LysR family transcriptional regulator [Sodalis sp. dw_96]
MDPFSRFALYFAEVARSGSLRNASEKLHVSASAINRQILNAEEEMGVLLFERLHSGLRLTSAGELLCDDLARWRREYKRTRERFDELQGLKRGHVSLALIQALSEGIIARKLAEIALEYPWLTMDISVNDSRDISRRVADAEVDFAIMLDPVEHHGLEVKAFIEIPIGIVISPNHPLASHKTLSISQMSEYRHIMPAAPLTVHDRIHLLYKRHSITPEAGIMCNDIRLIKSFIRESSGIGVLSRLDVITEVESGDLLFIPIQGKPVRPLTLALCVAPQRQLSRAAQMMIQKLAMTLDEMA